MFGLSIALLAIAVVVGLLGFTGAAENALGASQVTLIVVALLLAIVSMVVYRLRSHSR